MSHLKKTIGFFGGTFDPIHLGHLFLAVDLMEKHHLDEILFCPAFCSPFKTGAPPIASPKERLAMLKLALDLPQFKISSLELDQEKPSYTIDTLRQLHTNEVRFRLILSEESALYLDRWKETKELIRLAPPLIGPRQVPISSTEIRARLKEHRYCGHLIPAKVLTYIHTHKLYL